MSHYISEEAVRMGVGQDILEGSGHIFDGGMGEGGDNGRCGISPAKANSMKLAFVFLWQ